MSNNSAITVIKSGTTITGKIRSGQMELYGQIEGELSATALVIHPGARCTGTVRTDSAEIAGFVDGDVFVKQLCNIRNTGVVHGRVHYGKLALAEGGVISAEVKNVPPSLQGDFELSVERGKSVRITTEDLTAVDPDDQATDLVFSIANVVNGKVVLSDAPTKPVSRFTQAELLNGKVAFQHDDSKTGGARFDVVVTDKAGATSGKPQTVLVAVHSN